MKKLATLLMAGVLTATFSTSAMATPKQDDSPKKVAQHNNVAKKADKKAQKSDVKQVKKENKKAQKITRQ